MFFNKDLVLASIKAVGEDHAIVQYQDKEVEVNLSPEEAKEFHQYVVHQENMLVPMNIKTQKLFVDSEEPWYGQDFWKVCVQKVRTCSFFNIKYIIKKEIL